MIPRQFLYGILFLFITILFSYQLDVQGYNLASPSQKKNWWLTDSLEPFEDALKASSSSKRMMSRSSEELADSPLVEYLPGKPAPVELRNKEPYHLLEDQLPPARDPLTLSCVNSRSCYATDTEAYLSKTGNYRQLTNNYKRNYPDHCSAPRQELVLSFYKPSTVSAV
jgi:hypothetical protein